MGEEVGSRENSAFFMLKFEGRSTTPWFNTSKSKSQKTQLHSCEHEAQMHTGSHKVVYKVKTNVANSKLAEFPQTSF